MKKYVKLFPLFFMSVVLTSCGQNKTNAPKDNIKPETIDSITSLVSNSMVRNAKQDRNGNILIASYRGVSTARRALALILYDAVHPSSQDLDKFPPLVQCK